MHRRIAELKSEFFDVLVIGGGITGAWIALDCVSRGLSVALIEKGDFGAGTSAKSSKVIHGGIRYLQQLRLDKVRESALERAYYHRAAPHLTQFVPFMIPAYRSLAQGRTLLRAGMSIYRALCSGEDKITADPAKAVPPSFELSRDEALAKLPLAKANLTGALVYYESHMESSERMTLAVLDHAHHLGAVCANYVCARSPLLDQSNRVTGMLVEDVEQGQSFELRARLTVNATGPWIPALNRALFKDHSAVATTGYSRGSHLVTRQLIENYAVALPTRFSGQNVIDRGGRHIFIIPWRGCSLIGTSYIATEEIDDPVIERDEVEQLLGEINRQIPALDLMPQDVRHAFSGIYPLHDSVVRAKTYQGSGDYQIVDHAKLGYAGIISALGAKFTTARLVAEKVTDCVIAHLAADARACQTRSMRLASAAYDNLEHYAPEKSADCAKTLSADQVKRLIRQYGSKVESALAPAMDDSSLLQPLCRSRPNLKAEVYHAVEQEMAVRLDDFIYRRTGIGTIGFPDSECIDATVVIMSNLLGWDAARCALERQRLDRYKRWLDNL